MRLLNAFSLNMIRDFPIAVNVREISLEEAQAVAGCGIESAVGHADTAAVFSSELGMEVPANRISLTLEKGEEVLIGQYSGPRLAEGATCLPEGATIKWLLLTVG